MNFYGFMFWLFFGWIGAEESISIFYDLNKIKSWTVNEWLKRKNSTRTRWISMTILYCLCVVVVDDMNLWKGSALPFPFNGILRFRPFSLLVSFSLSHYIYVFSSLLCTSFIPPHSQMCRIDRRKGRQRERESIYNAGC